MQLVGRRPGTLPASLPGEEPVHVGRMVRELPAVQVNEVGAGGVEKVGVVRNAQQRALKVLGQVLVEPKHGREVQVVRRFVQQQQRRLEEQSPGQSDAHPPPSAESRRAVRLHGAGEAQASQDRAHAGLRRVRLDRHELLNYLQQPLHRSVPRRVGSVGRRRAVLALHHCEQPSFLREQLGPLLVRCQHLHKRACELIECKR